LKSDAFHARSLQGKAGACGSEIHALYRGILDRIPRTATRVELEPIADLTLLADEILTLLESHVKPSISSANESQTERHTKFKPKPPS
jgi:replication initiation protein RepC